MSMYSLPKFDQKNLLQLVWRIVIETTKVLTNALKLSILLILNFVGGAFLLLYLQQFMNIQLAEFEIHHESGLIIVAVLTFLSISLSYIIEQEGYWKENFEVLPHYAWKYIRAGTSHTDHYENRDEARQYYKKKILYADYTIKTLPAIFLAFTAPVFLVYAYTDPMNFTAVSVLLIGIGITMGSFGNIIDRKVVKTNLEEEIEQEIHGITAKQYEFLFLLYAAVMQLLGVFNVRSSEILQIFFTFILAIIFVAPALFLYFLSYRC